MWRTLENFATNSVCLVISSGAYDEVEYIRNFKKFKQFLKIEEGQTEANSLDSESIQESKTIVQDSTVLGCSQIELPTIKSRAGNLTPIHCSLDIPFDVKRVFFVYDIPYGKTRGMHAHKKCHQFLLAASGSFDVELDDGKSKRSISVNRPTQGIHVLPGIWSKEYNYSSGAICLVLASEAYTEEDYIRKYSDFKKMYGN
ncbi:WxcM-like domain-containing protein [Dysgonomonas sp. HGC4]|nr:WxcM-like domain-containing protein [Dysgonomonas sp. HGC4]